MKRFMYLSISILCLSVAALIGFYVGSRTAEAQVPLGAIAGFGVWQPDKQYVILTNGDVYTNSPDFMGSYPQPARFYGNFWGPQSVPTSPGTWGSVKSKYDGNK